MNKAKSIQLSVSLCDKIKIKVGEFHENSFKNFII